jgi:hypothetical protein
MPIMPARTDVITFIELSFPGGDPYWCLVANASE